MIGLLRHRGRLRQAETAIDVGNSGTTLYIALGTACLVEGSNTLTGDDQTRRRPPDRLSKPYAAWGRECIATIRTDSPVRVDGAMTGGAQLSTEANSQYLTSLLINCPLASGDTEIEVTNLIEKPYVEMTLKWIDEQGSR